MEEGARLTDVYRRVSTQYRCDDPAAPPKGRFAVENWKGGGCATGPVVCVGAQAGWARHGPFEAAGLAPASETLQEGVHRLPCEVARLREERDFGKNAAPSWRRSRSDLGLFRQHAGRYPVRLVCRVLQVVPTEH